MFTQKNIDTFTLVPASDIADASTFLVIVDGVLRRITKSELATLFGGSGGIIPDGSITAAKLAANSVITSKILDQNVTEAKLADGAVSDVKLADDSVTTDKIINGAVTDVKIAPNAVTTAKIANLAVNTSKLADNTVTLTKTNAVVWGFVGVVDEGGGDLFAGNYNIGATTVASSVSTYYTSTASGLRFTGLTGALKPQCIVASQAIYPSSNPPFTNVKGVRVDTSTPDELIFIVLNANGNPTILDINQPFAFNFFGTRG